MNARRTMLIGVILTSCTAAAVADGSGYTFTLIPQVGSAPTAALNPISVNEAGMVAGEYWLGNSPRLFASVGGVTTDLHPQGVAGGAGGAAPSTSVLLEFNEAGQVLGHACVPPAGGGFGCAENWFLRFTPGVGVLRLDTLPGAPLAAYPWTMNDAGDVAVAHQPVAGQGLRIAVYRDAPGGGVGGWTDLGPVLPAGVNSPTPVAFTDAGLLVSAGGVVYLYSGGVATQIFPGSTFVYAMNNSGMVTGQTSLGGPLRLFRGRSAATIESLDPAWTIPGAYGTRINDAGMVAGVSGSGFFFYSDAEGLIDLGKVVTVNESDIIEVSSLNGRGEMITWEREVNYDVDPIVYEMVPAMREVGGAQLRRVQDVVDPLVERVRIIRVSSINDSGQFAVSGTDPVHGGPVAFLLTPIGAPACDADFNGQNGATVQDIYDFLADWNSQVGGGAVIMASADFNGEGGVTVQDIYDFLGAWNLGCE